MGAGDDRSCLYAGTVGQGDAGRPAAGHVYRGDLCVGADLRARGPRGRGYGVGDAAHAAAHEAPAAGDAVDLAHPVVQEDVGRTWAHRAAPHADDAPRGERALYPLVNEVAVEEVRAAHRHQVDEPRDAPAVAEGVATEREALDHVGERPDARVWRLFVEQRPHEIRQLA